MIYGFIVCAGKQSRFKSETPKALVDVGGETLLAKNLREMSPFCDKIFVVCSVENQHHFRCENKIVIRSGKGSGDAVWQALKQVQIKSGDTGFVLWGDSFLNRQVYASAIENFKGKSLIPCRFEENPYVQVVQKENDRVEILFSKFKDPITAGLHDLSVFYCPLPELLAKLTQFRENILDKSGHYGHKHNNEMEFLDVFNDTNIKCEVLELKNCKAFSFNTLEQLGSIKDGKF